jgi:hypothetical protein
MIKISCLFRFEKFKKLKVWMYDCNSNHTEWI